MQGDACLKGGLSEVSQGRAYKQTQKTPRSGAEVHGKEERQRESGGKEKIGAGVRVVQSKPCQRGGEVSLPSSHKKMQYESREG